jgi:hypothetical protein
MVGASGTLRSMGDARVVDDAVSLPEPDTLTSGPGDVSAAEPTPSLRCVPDGCEIWRREDVRYGRVVVNGDLAVHVGQTEVTAVDTADGSIRWTAVRARRDGIRRPELTAAALHLDDDILTVPTGRDIVAYDPVDGTVRWSREVEAVVAEVARWGDLLLIGSSVTGSSFTDALHVDAVDLDGEQVWGRELEGMLDGLGGLAADDDLLFRTAEHLVALDPATGAERWQRPVDAVEVARGGFGLVTLDPATGRVDAVDPATGDTLAAATVTGAERLQPLGPWIGVDTGEELHVLDASATTLMVVPGTWTGSSGARLRDDVYVAWMDDDRSEVELVRHTVGGDPVERLVVPTPSGAATPCCADLAVTEAGSLLLTIGGGRLMLGVEPGSVRVTTSFITAVAPGRAISPFGDLTVVMYETGRLEVVGPTGIIAAFGTGRAVSRDPLLVHGVHGLLRLDEALVLPPTLASG